MFQRPAMEKHELHCTANIHRKCNVCNLRDKSNDIPVILDTIFAVGRLPTLQEIRTLTDNCPACILTILRALQRDGRYGYFYYSYPESDSTEWLTPADRDLICFDYKEEMKNLIGESSWSRRIPHPLIEFDYQSETQETINDYSAENQSIY
jgi:hypothetical protein